MQTGTLLHTFKGHQKTVLALAFSPDSELILTGDVNGQTYLWETKSGKRVNQFSAGLLESDIHFLPDGIRAVTASYIDGLDLWNIETGKLIRQFDPTGYTAVFPSADTFY